MAEDFDEYDYIYSDGIVATVNEDAMTKFDVDATDLRDSETDILMKYDPEELKKNDEYFKLYHKEVFESRYNRTQRLIDQEVLYKEFNRLGYQVPQELVTKRMAKVIHSRAKGDIEKFRAMLSNFQITYDEYRKKIEKQVAVDLLLNEFVYRRIKVSPKLIEKYFSENIVDFSKDLKVDMDIIALKMTSRTYKKDSADIKKLLAEGKGEEVLKKYSKYVTNNEVTLADINRDAFTKIEKGQFSKEVVSKRRQRSFWYKVNKVGGEHAKLNSEIRNKMSRILSRDKRKRLYDQYLAQVKSKTYTENYYEDYSKN